MTRRLGMLSLVLTMAMAGSAMAQQHATLLLTSGERISGDLVDLGGVGFTINVNGSERRIPTGEVAVIDFSGDATNFPSTELNKLGSGQGVVLNSGEVVQGKLDDIGGTHPLRLTFNLTAGGSRDLNSTDVKRIYLSRPAAAGASTTTAPPTVGPSGAGIPVPANQGWVDTGITVRKGQGVTFTASGEVQLSSDANDKASPAGSLRGRYPSAPMRQVLAGALIGRIGSGSTSMFGIGTQTVPLPMPADGRLFLAVNDDVRQDNQGQFLVQVRPGSAMGR